jgi:CRISPR-associated protein Csc2
MTTLDQLQQFFPDQVAIKPSGHYAHIITLRVTESYSIFRTDGDLNTAQVAIGREDDTLIDRITMFMRKQTTPERLRGRELLRKYQPEKMEDCRYNNNPCGECPDCLAYGYAIGDSGAEKSKVFGDTAYSLTGHAVSHTVRTFNAPNEGGIMYDHDEGQTSNRINAVEYALPGLIFPSVTTTRDLTFGLFCYVLNNTISTKRYGAITTRTGRVDNQVMAIILADGEIMSNLALTQALYDALNEKGKWQTDDLIKPADTKDAFVIALAPLLQEADINIQAQLTGRDLSEFMAGFRAEVSQNPQPLIQALFPQVADYRTRLTTKPKKKGK